MTPADLAQREAEKRQRPIFVLADNTMIDADDYRPKLGDIIGVGYPLRWTWKR